MASSKQNKDSEADPTPDTGPATATAGTKTPFEWAATKGLVAQPDPATPWVTFTNDPIFNAADALHGWTPDAQAYQAEKDRLRISEADFDKALECAAQYPEVGAHEPACGRHFKDRAKKPVSLRQQQAAKRAAASGKKGK